MFHQNDDVFEAVTKPATEAFEYWISFFPTAPLFGVEWRFAEMMPQADLATGFMPGVGGAFGYPAPATPAPTPAAEVETVCDTAAPESAAHEAVTEIAVEASDDLIVEDISHDGTIAEENAAVLAPPACLMSTKPAATSDLKLIKGIGPALERQLNGLGLYTFDQIAGLSDIDLAWVDDNLTSFKGRCFRDDWVGQAKVLLG